MFSISGFMGIVVGLIILFWLIVVGVVVFVVVYLLKYNDQKKQEQKEKPLEILKERYAKGEISKEEFEGKKQELKKD